MTPRPHCELYVAACDKAGGIFRFAMTDEGKLTRLDMTPCDRPMYMAISGNTLFCLLRAPFEGTDESGLVTFAIGPDGRLTPQPGVATTHGNCACHLSLLEGEVYAVNYLSGSVVRLPDTLRVHTGHGPNPVRQEAAHTHMVTPTPDGYLVVADLGTDTLTVYDRDLRPLSSAKVPDGHGARHVVFSHDGRFLFCVNELRSTVSVFAYERATLTLLHTVPALPEGEAGIGNTAAAIRLSHDGRYLYVSHRGLDMITCFGVDGSTLTPLSYTPCGGKRPRDFDLIDGYAVCTNEGDHSVTVLKADGPRLTLVDRAENVPGALCVLRR